MPPSVNSTLTLNTLSLFGVRAPSFNTGLALNSVHDKVFPRGHLLIDGKPSDDLLALLDSIKIPHDGTAGGILDALISVVWQKDRERRIFKPDLLLEPSMEQTLALHKMSFIAPVRAPMKEYGDVLVMGGPMPWFRARLSMLAAESQRGVTFERLVMLSGDRRLDPASESMSHLKRESPFLKIKPAWEYKGSKWIDETDMMKAVCDQSVLPKELAGVPVIFIKDLRGESKRNVSTSDTVHKFLEECTPNTENPVLIASSQPYISYQTFSAAGVYKERGIEAPGFHGIGPGLRSTGYIINYLDQIVRRLGREISC